MFFFTGPSRSVAKGGWVVGERGSWLWGLPCWDNCANNSSLTSRAALCTRSNSWKMCVSVATFWTCCLCKFKDEGLSSSAERMLILSFWIETYSCCWSQMLPDPWLFINIQKHSVNPVQVQNMCCGLQIIWQLPQLHATCFSLLISEHVGYFFMQRGHLSRKSNENRNQGYKWTASFYILPLLRMTRRKSPQRLCFVCLLSYYTGKKE